MNLLQAVARLEFMRDDNSYAWNLSDSDREALRIVLDKYFKLQHAYVLGKQDGIAQEASKRFVP